AARDDETELPAVVGLDADRVLASRTPVDAVVGVPRAGEGRSRKSSAPVDLLPPAPHAGNTSNTTDRAATDRPRVGAARRAAVNTAPPWSPSPPGHNAANRLK